MSVWLITYDLKGNAADYTDLIQGIKQLGSHCHIQESVWLVDTSWAAPKILERLNPHIRKERHDRLFIARLHRDWASVDFQDAPQWLDSARRSWD